MWVRQLIGRQAGTIVEMPFADAQLAKANDTAADVTAEEIAEAGHQVQAQATEAPAEKMIEGYRVESSLRGGGFDVFDAGGVRINDDPLHNHIVARDHAVAHARAMRALPPLAVKTDRTAEYEKSTVDQLKAEAKARSVDDSKATKKKDWVTLLINDDAEKAKSEAGAGTGANGDVVQDPDFDAMSIAQLEVIAADQNIDLAGITDQPAMAAAVKAAYKAPETITA